ncbi:MAG: hypothetical protein AMJ60_01870 [Desulfobacterales bacterium SG8_35]|nr:MAG: hypothetical protein AMJ60_01870 [Desulfobacterales bacterium SG8_35]
MLVATLNYNQPQLTDNLVEQLKRDNNFGQHEIMVLDNGSTKKKAKYTTHFLPKNIFFGGGLNIVLRYFLETDHKFFVLFNNDLIFHGPRLIENMISEMGKNDLALYSPSIINAGVKQCVWQQMWNWGTRSVREVPFIDFMCPVFRRDLAGIIGQFPRELFLGWGPDLYAGIIADKHDLKVGVSDNITLLHLFSQTFRTGAIEIKESDFNQQADKNMHQYFYNSEYKDKFIEFYQKGREYSI